MKERKITDFNMKKKLLNLLIIMLENKIRYLLNKLNINAAVAINILYTYEEI